jgi:glycosyltransferase involved in cell wall biosynthesis
MTDRRSAKVLEVTSYPPPRAGWAVRVEFLKRELERQGHVCVVLNTGVSRRIPSPEYETVLSGGDLLAKLWRFSRQGFVVHAHANGDSPIGVVLAIAALLVNLACGRRGYLTFHAGVIQRYFPRNRSPILVPLYWFLFALPRRIICNSDPVKQCIAAYGIPLRKIAAIPAFSRQYLEFTPKPLPPDLSSHFANYRHVVFSYLRLRPLFFPLTLVDGVALIAGARDDVGFVFCGGTGHSEPGLWESVQERIRRHGVTDRICFVDDLDHDAFLTAVQRSSVYLRTPITDGVASSVLEALALGVPVVACENGTRPAGVVTYPAEDAQSMADAVLRVLADHGDGPRQLDMSAVPDTLPEEIGLLTSHL